MDLTGNAEARIWVSAVKAMVPVRVCEIIDEAIQIHGAAGISQWTPLASMYAAQRTLRLADGPDEVHWHVVGRAEPVSYTHLDVYKRQTGPRLADRVVALDGVLTTVVLAIIANSARTDSTQYVVVAVVVGLVAFVGTVIYARFIETTSGGGAPK